MLNVITGALDIPTPPVYGAFESIQTYTLGSSQSSVTFSSIPSTYKHLQIRVLTKDTDATYGTGLQAYIRMNSDSGSNYAHHFLRGQGASAAAGAGSNRTEMYINYYPGSNSNTYGFGVAVIDLLDYANTSKYKTVRSLSGDDLNGSGTVALSSGLWMNTSAINQIVFTPNVTAFAANSSFALYGIKG